MDSETSVERNGTLSSGSTQLQNGEISLTLEEINIELLQNLKELSLAIDKYDAIEENNSVILEKYEDSKLIMDYKKSVVEGLTHEVQYSEVTRKDIPRHYGQVVMDITTSLTKVLKDMRDYIDVNQTRLNAIEMEEACLNKNIKTLKNITMKRSEEGEMREQKELEKINTALGTKFLVYRQMLHSTIKDVFPDDPSVMSDFLAELITALYNQIESGYVDVAEEVDYKYIELLLQSDIIVRHPYEKNRVRLVSTA